MVDPNPNTAHVLLIVDKSGSMMDIKDDAEGGIASFLDEQRNLRNANDEKIDVTLSLADFNHDFNWWVRNISLDKVSRYVLRPSGTTALLDAIGRGISEDVDYRGLSSVPTSGRTVCVIVTDGVENASREWTDAGVKKLIKEQRENHGWEFVFLAKDIETIEMGRNIGLQTTQFAATPAGTRSAYGVTSHNVGSYLSGATTRVANPSAIPDKS